MVTFSRDLPLELLWEAGPSGRFRAGLPPPQATLSAMAESAVRGPKRRVIWLMNAARCGILHAGPGLPYPLQRDGTRPAGQLLSKRSKATSVGPASVAGHACRRDGRRRDASRP